MCVDSLEIFKKFNEDEACRSRNSAIDEFLTTDLADVQNRNEKTPSKTHSFAVTIRNPGDKPKSAKCLFESPSTSTVNGPTQSVQTPSRLSFKLTEIYKRLYGNEPESAHNAEADTMHLMSCCIAIKNDFVKMADSMAVKFVDVKII